MKTAKEMFEELGYEQQGILHNTFFIYYKEKAGVEISFDLADKTFIKYSRALGVFITINMKELQAINKMVSELGWLDE
jgi:hypothetical protein